ncbi:P-type conjugative transfer protein TrbL (plasmid) [Shewanella xiamenensis]|uniref:P-type conjugative transfer protein TrbL n=1 Tax=Shewanella xiamenensis TaxID=332186 RepID=UPI0024AE5332|nr:P-type conjugative transfer protein TrbL [Shewanella xiamenensis]WHF58017.1 P-type conjugative transfer protein TrbL [Shewanella xiamenensis]
MRLVITLLLLLLIPNAYAQGVPESGAIDELLRTFENAAGQWPPVLRQYATYVFFALVTISWVWSFMWMAFKEANITELLAELARRSLMIGFFYYLLMDGTYLAAKIVEGFQFLAQALTGKYIHPSSIFDIGYSLASEIIKKLSWTDMVDGLGFVLAGIGILIVFAFIALEMLLVIIQYYIMLNLGVIMMGFLGHEWSREYAINYFRLMLGLGVKFLSMQMIVVLSLNILHGWLNTSDLTWTQILLILPCIIVIWGLVREVPALAQSLISGTDSTSGNSIAGAMQAVAATAALAAGAYAAAGAMGGGAMGGGANMGNLLRNAWDQANGTDSDPATSPLPDSDSGSGESSGSGSSNMSSELPRSHGNNSSSGNADGGDFQGSISGSSSSGTAPDSSSPSSSAPAAKRSMLSTAGKAAQIAGATVAKETLSSAKNAFLSGLKRPIENRNQDTVIGRAANSLSKTSGDPSQDAPIKAAKKSPKK